MKSSKTQDKSRHKTKSLHQIGMQRLLAECKKVTKEADPVAYELLADVFDIASDLEVAKFQSARYRTYLSQVVSEIVIAIEHHSSAEFHSFIPLHETLTEVLIRQNFNSAKIYCSWVDSFSSKLSTQPTSEQKLNLLYLERKKINQTLVDPELCFDGRFPHFKSMLDSWIGEEIAYLERALKGECEKANHPVEDYFNGRPLKLQLDMSVAQFSCLVRALVEGNIVVNSNLTELSILMGKFVITKRVENVSPNSFRHKYYEIEDSSRKAVIKMLKSTIDWLNQR